jgi:hypothetical protein
MEMRNGMKNEKRRERKEITQTQTGIIMQLK